MYIYHKCQCNFRDFFNNNKNNFKIWVWGLVFVLTCLLFCTFMGVMVYMLLYVHLNIFSPYINDIRTERMLPENDSGFSITENII